ncbi:hypothetical protein KP509_30G042400 [Ceratopteris richardii]|uniref:Uncharacterized protein n=1 Tax=Ceratopteris richardii TaxID=49495 RepID=A0A8T2R3L6_CERRI|nr:hypothetical protein KP509_30G042400 [Ceratopteris richardii]
MVHLCEACQIGKQSKQPFKHIPNYVKATLYYRASILWWKKGINYGNMHEITSSDQFYDMLSVATPQDKLVLVDFYPVGCQSFKACQITVNFYDNLDFCRTLNVNLLPFFHFYRNNVKNDGFSSSLSKIDKLRAAVARN